MKDLPVSATTDDQPRRGKVLVVEDELIIALALRVVLADIGFQQVTLFSQASEALVHLETDVPDFALLDYRLTRGETSEDLSLELLNRNIPFAFLTGFGGSPSKNPRLLHVPTLSKPVEQRDLERCLEAN